jgi:hypothetical protein
MKRFHSFLLVCAWLLLCLAPRAEAQLLNHRPASAWLPGFPRGEREIWVKQRQQRDILLSLDPKARWEKHEARKCPRCGRWMLGIQAQMQRERNLCARFNNQPLAPCDLSLCKTRSTTL